MKSKELVRAGAVSVLAVFMLSGCNTWHKMTSYITSDSAMVCPDVAILANTSVLPAFDPAKGGDPSNVAYNITMSKVKSRCDYSKHTNKIDADVRITFNATRAPGGEAAHYKVPYFVAVTNNGEIIDKQIRWAEFDFPKAVPNMSQEVFVGDINIDVAQQKHTYEYHLLVGFQLTQAQIDYNKRVGQYLP